MELTQAQLNSLQSLTVNSAKIKADNLPVGQQILVKVAAVDPQSGEVTLKINDTLVTAKTSLQLSAGQTLQLIVTQSTANKVTLQLPPTLVDAVTQQQAQQKALREALPKQQPITDAIIQLKALIKPGSATQLPASIIQFAQKFVSRLPTPNQLSSPAGVKQAIQQSGVFLENKLSNLLSGTSKNEIGGDVKALFLGLKATLLRENKLVENKLVENKLVENKLSEKNQQIQNLKPETKPSTLLNATSTRSSQVQTNAALIKILGNNPLQTLSPKNLASNALVRPAPLAPVTTKSGTATDEELQYKKIVDNRALEASIAAVLKNTENTLPTNKQLTDKQIQQLLSNLFSQQKGPTNTHSQNPLTKPTLGAASPPPLPLLNTAADKTTGVIFKSAQQYASLNTAVAANEITMTAIKSQNVHEARTPRINNLIDLIETLIKQVDSAISRTQVHQLNTLQDQETGKLSMSMEIPVNDDDHLHLVRLDIEKQASKNETETVFTVNLAIDLNEIGPVYARITLVNDSTSVVLWSERDSTFQLVQQSINTLHTKLEDSGLKSDNIACHHGQPPQNQRSRTDNDNDLLNGLVDVRA